MLSYYLFLFLLECHEEPADINGNKPQKEKTNEETICGLGELSNALLLENRERCDIQIEPLNADVNEFQKNDNEGQDKTFYSSDDVNIVQLPADSQESDFQKASKTFVPNTLCQSTEGIQNGTIGSYSELNSLFSYEDKEEKDFQDESLDMAGSTSMESEGEVNGQEMITINNDISGLLLSQDVGKDMSIESPCKENPFLHLDVIIPALLMRMKE